MVSTNISHLDREEQIPFCVLQGLVNRAQPQLYLEHDPPDAHWLDWLRKRGDIAEVDTIEPADVFKRYRDRVSGCIVTDPEVPGTVNVATLLGGLRNAVVVAPRLVERHGLRVIEDLRGRWKRSIDAYRWAYRELLPSAQPLVLAHINPFSARLRDYLAEFNVFTFWLSGDKGTDGEEEITFARELFERVGPNVPILGWWASHGQGPSTGIWETRGVPLASEYGLFTVCVAWDGYCEGTSNLSVHSGTSATFKQQPAPPPPPLEKKVYYSFIRTDGDGVNFWRQEFLKLWKEPQHGQFPMNWPIGGLVCELEPDILDYFYRNASADDYFMAAVSGVGYIHEDVYGAKLTDELRKSGFEQFLRLTAEQMRRMDLREIHTYKTTSDELVRQYAKTQGVRALFLDYNRNEVTTPENVTTVIDGIPVFRTVLKGSDFRGRPWKEQVSSAAAQIRMYTPPQRPAFLSVTLSNWGYQDETQMQSLEVVRELEKTLVPEYQAVRADHLVQLCRAHYASREK